MASTSTSSTLASLFMKYFIVYSWFEPIFCEIILGLLLFFFPTNELVTQSFFHTPLFNAMKESIAIQDSLQFLMRFISMLLTMFGGLHLLILLACHYHGKLLESQRKWSDNRLFNAMIAVLWVGDCFHVVCVLSLEGSLSSYVVYQLPLTIHCVFVRGLFLLLNRLQLVSDF